MKIFVSKFNGFCNGVKNAVDIALNSKGDRVFSYGKIIHNKRVVEELRQKGVVPIEDLSVLRRGDTLIIRAHGAPKSVFDYCAEKGVAVADATCVFVRRIRERAREYHEKGYRIVLLGDKNHPEIVGVNGWCGDSAIITDGTEKVDLSAFDKVLVMFQTTFNHLLAEEALVSLGPR